MNPANGRIATEHENLATYLFSPLGFEQSSCIFFQTDTRLKTLPRSLSGFQEEADNFFCIDAERGGPGLEIILRIGKTLPMFLRHMRGYHDQIPLAATSLGWTATSFPWKNTSTVLRVTRTLTDSPIRYMEQNTCLIRPLRYNQEELSDPTRETVHRD